ncbi:MAG: right-handed parallel beta-helix repeat-containing protein, partial [Muribaculaceae bacterium]|nr:right-handed parallel beta-helix repeat-containing protein [Muribaculaceae bacterium]
MKTLKSLLAIIAAVAIAAATFTSCIEDGFTTSPSDQPVFSTATLDLGDLFTLGPSPTARFTVYNRHD